MIASALVALIALSFWIGYLCGDARERERAEVAIRDAVATATSRNAPPGLVFGRPGKSKAKEVPEVEFAEPNQNPSN